MKIRKHIAISDSGVIFNGATGDSFSVNPIAAEVINLIKEGKSKDEIEIVLSEKYDTNSERLDGDLYDFFSHLRQLNLLESEE